MCVIVRQPPILEQSLPEHQPPRVLGGYGRYGPDRFLAGASLRRWRLSGCQRARIEADKRRKQEAYQAAIGR